MKLVIATRNAHKLAEIRAILDLPDVEIVGTEAWPDVSDPVEDGITFEENAIIKANAWAAATGLPALADDSGLEVDALEGAPGIHSARYAGEHGNSVKNNALLLKNLEGMKNRNARFVCALALALPSGEIRVLRGACEGSITQAENGAGGFGYDPLFIPEGYSETFATLPELVKNSLSHRARALQAAREWFA